jgi:hypothetical protein
VAHGVHQRGRGSCINRATGSLGFRRHELRQLPRLRCCTLDDFNTRGLQLVEEPFALQPAAVHGDDGEIRQLRGGKINQIHTEFRSQILQPRDHGGSLAREQRGTGDLGKLAGIQPSRFDLGDFDIRRLCSHLVAECLDRSVSKECLWPGDEDKATECRPRSRHETQHASLH